MSIIDQISYEIFSFESPELCSRSHLIQILQYWNTFFQLNELLYTNEAFVFLKTPLLKQPHYEWLINVS